MDPDRTEGAAGEVHGRVEEAVGQVVGDRLTQTRGTIERATTGVAETASGQMRDTAPDIADRGSGGLADALEAGEDALSRGGAALRQRLTEKPVSTLLVAAALGWVLALVLRGGRR